MLHAIKQRLSYEREVQSRIARDLKRSVRRGGPPLRILDVGCGRTSILAQLNKDPARRDYHFIGLDAHGPTIEWCRRHGFHDEYLLCDARDHAAIPQVDVVVATDLVEHFDKTEALELITHLEHRATTGVILFTPNGYIYNPFTAANPYMEHKCGFTVAEFTAMGYTCTGMGGPRFIRGVNALPRRPMFLSLPALLVLGRLLRPWPRHSFHILASKLTASAVQRSTPEPLTERSQPAR